MLELTMDGRPAAIELPAPERDRWQPLRAGLVDVFLYDHEEFRFRDGKLLLRGNNGTGKSKVLALLLPFLLDGSMAAHRVEPDGDRGKQMEWNLLMGGRYDERLGYTWLELGRIEEDGTERFLTLGCGLKAVAGRGIAAHWFFVTSQRIGVDLWLIGRGGTTLTRDRLVEAIGTSGMVLGHAEQFRRAVDEHLFRLGANRYDALVNLLVQLRQPQLSRRPDEGRLSTALSEALRPVDQAIISDVAAAFHDLEQQRLELRGLEEARTHVTRFLARYRHYAGIAARRQAGELRTAQSQYDELGRQLGTQRQELERAEAEERAAAGRLDTARHQLAAARVRERELSESRELRDLAAAEASADEATGLSAEAGVRHESLSAQLESRRKQLATAEGAVSESRGAVSARASTAAGVALDAGLDHAAVVAPLDLPDGADEARLQAAERAAAEDAARRERAVRHVLELVGAVEAAEARLAEARRRLHELEAERDRAAEQLRTAEAAVTERGAELVARWRRHLGALVELAVPSPEAVEEAMLAWVETLDGESPAWTALVDAAAARRQALAGSLAEALGRLAEVEAALALLRQERERLLRGETERPPAPYTRSPAVREGRPGAPLWELVDFRDEVPMADRAGLEAALEASGLLDAWVTPDGRLLEPETHDIVVTAGRAVPAHLGQALLPAIDRDDASAAAVADGTVVAVLAGIGLGAATADTWVEASGRWRLGVVEGRWAKPAARFIGRGAREAARRQRLAELTVEIPEAEAAVVAAEEARDAVHARQRTVEAELSGAPTDRMLRDAHSALSLASDQLLRRREAVEAQEEVVESAAGAVRGARETRDEEARDLSLPAGRDGLEAVRRAVGAYREAVAALWPAIGRHLDRLRALAGCERDVRTAGELAQRAEVEREAAERRAVEALARRDALSEKLGATVEQLRARLGEARDDVARLKREEGEQEQVRLDALGRAAGARGRVASLEERTQPVTARRDTAVTAFQRFGTSGLLAVALPDVELPAGVEPWAPDPAVRIARRVDQRLTDLDAGDDAWARAQREFTTGFRELGDALLRHGHHASADPQEDRYVVSIVFDGRERRPDELAELLTEDIEHRDRLLNAREREVLEEHLVNEVASHVQELITDAEAQVERMNDELERRPTSTGMRLRFRWQPDAGGPAGLAEARRRLLRQATEAWSPEDRSAVGAFLQGLIAAERMRNESGTWLEHLTKAFDYRSWHRFTIERWQDGRWRAAGGPASGGERVLTVTLPLFAAASAHYRSAHPAAPRMIMLDEAFAGVDDDSRAKCLGLLATFDLDLMMTSEREWACYPTVPGIAISHLTRREGVDAVHVSRWEWDGARRTRSEGEPPPAAPPGE